ncbi:MAG: AraC family transcriptional regulator [Acidimicrobiaceae bacterium]|nr:AraC family transcriptional regulator [Acidimicrobiaceae bacterium]
MAYRERASTVPGITVWQRDARPSTFTGRILPDGCMDLIWDGSRLVVAGPDTRARWHTMEPNVGYVGLRFSRGLGPALLAIRADELLDVTADLGSLWPSGEARVLSEQVAAAPEAALEAWAGEGFARRESPRIGSVVFELAASGTPVAAMADCLGIGVRQLHRRCLPLFGYGPQHLARVLRLDRALVAAHRGVPLVDVAATAGFADQAHLSREVRDLAGTTPRRLLGESGL